MSKRTSLFVQGIKSALPFVPVLIPFAMLFGILADGFDLSALQTAMYSLVVYAGAAQITTLTMLADNAPLFIAILAGSIINLRTLLYSAALSPYFKGVNIWTRLAIAYTLIDQAFVLGQQKFEAEPDLTKKQRVDYYFGITVVIFFTWSASALLGYFFGGVLLAEIDISFGLPLAFIALIAPSLKSPPHILAALISITGTLLLSFIPNNLGLLISGLIATIAAAQLEKLLEGRKHE